MFKRAYAFKLNLEAGEVEIRKLIEVLERAPSFIPGMTSSIVHPFRGSDKFDIVWDSGFIDELATNYIYRIHIIAIY
jgi:hypothetical protein